MSAPDLDRLAAWDPGPLRGATGSLTAVADRLPAWRSRLEAVGRELETAGGWTGPAADQAAAAVIALSTAATAVTRACESSLSWFHRLAVHARSARALAEQAIGLAAGVGVRLDAAGEPERPLPSPAAGMAPDQADTLVLRAATAARASELAADALRHGAAAASAADEADEALRAVGVAAAFAPATFTDLAGVVGVGRPLAIPPVPIGRSPAAVAAWWAGLDAATQRAALDTEPGLLGNLDGLPAWARDRANRVLLAVALQNPGLPGHDVALAVAGTLWAREAGGDPVQLYEFAPGDGLVAVALGDLDTADDVAVLVPGIFTTATDDLGTLIRDAAGVADAARAAAPGAAVATVAWLGYRTPQSLPEAAVRHDARTGGRALAADLAGLARSRTAAGARPARTTVLAHSYGTVVADEAARRPGRLAADAVVLMGSPGTGSGGAAELEAPEVYAADDRSDRVASLRWFGEAPWEPGYGAIPLPTDGRTGHTGYYDPDHPTLAALGGVVAGPYLPR